MISSSACHGLVDKTASHIAVALVGRFAPDPMASLVVIYFSRSCCGLASASGIVMSSANSCELSYAATIHRPSCLSPLTKTDYDPPTVASLAALAAISHWPDTRPSMM